MKAICKNCRYLGALLDNNDLVCSRKNLQVVKLDDTCNDYIQGICERCGSNDISFYKHIPDDEPYVVRTEYTCQSCKNFWYIDV